MDCPRCSSDETLIISSNYPKTFECKSCGHIFLKSTQALIDE